MHSGNATDANLKQGDFSGTGSVYLCDYIPHWGVTSLTFITWSTALCLPSCLTLLLPKATPGRGNIFLVPLAAFLCLFVVLKRFSFVFRNGVDKTDWERHAEEMQACSKWEAVTGKSRQLLLYNRLNKNQMASVGVLVCRRPANKIMSKEVSTPVNRSLFSCI